MDQSAADDRFLYAWDLVKDGVYTTATVEISAVHKPGTFTFKNGKVCDRLALEFKGKSKKFAPPYTQCELLRVMLKSNSPSAWVGEKITLYVSKITSFGGKDEAIRIKPDRINGVPPNKIRKQMGEDLTGTSPAE